MQRLAAGAAGLAMLIAGPCAAGTSSEVLGGRWLAAWDNDSQNLLTIDANHPFFSGRYFDDDQDACTLQGKFDEDTRAITMSIKCPGFTDDLEGFYSQATQTPGGADDVITGSYKGAGGSGGTFMMTRRP